MRTTLMAGFAGLLLAACDVATTPDPWNGVTPPGPLASPRLSPDDAPAPPVVPDGEQEDTALLGGRIMPSVAQVVGYAEDMRAAGNQMWGRIAGFPSETLTAEWVASKFEEAGLVGVRLQEYAAEDPFWWPNSWEVQVLADAGEGETPEALTLASAVPTAGSELPKGPVTADLIDVGDAGAIREIAVDGKIALQRVRPERSAYTERAKTRDSARALIEAGAVGVINWVEQAGNMHVYDFAGCGGVCFNVGDADGRFLQELLAARGDAGLKVSLSLDAEYKEGLVAHNVLGMLPGPSDEIVIVNAHLDGWFNGAGDNADGVAVMIALAEHFATQPRPPERTLLFVGSGGHHSRGLNGPAAVVAQNADVMSNVVAVVNLEHLAQFEMRPFPWTVSASEEAKRFGVSNLAPYIVSAVEEGAERYGFVLQPEINETVPGDLGGYAPLGVVRMQGIHSGPLYHTSGDDLDSISEEGLERAARFYAFLIDKLLVAGASDLNP